MAPKTFTRYDETTYTVEVGDRVWVTNEHQQRYADQRWTPVAVVKVGPKRVHLDMFEALGYRTDPMQFQGESQAECSDRPGSWWFRTQAQRLDEERRETATQTTRQFATGSWWWKPTVSADRLAAIARILTAETFVPEPPQVDPTEFATIIEDAVYWYESTCDDESSGHSFVDVQAVREWAEQRREAREQEQRT